MQAGLRKDVRLQDNQLAGPCPQLRRANRRFISGNRRGHCHPLDPDSQRCPAPADGAGQRRIGSNLGLRSTARAVVHAVVRRL
jgi:hypothetical protein